MLYLAIALTIIKANAWVTVPTPLIVFCFVGGILGSLLDTEGKPRNHAMGSVTAVSGNTTADALNRMDMGRVDSVGEWISVKERLPKKRKNVLVRYGNGRIDFDWIDSTQCFVFENLYGRVTHWMPLPEPPEENQQYE